MSTQYEMRWNDSIHEFVNAAAKRADPKAASHRGGGWSGSDSFDQAVDFAKQGTWEPGDVSEFRNMFDELIPKLREYTDQNFVEMPDTSGFEVNMQAFVDGEPDHMRQWMPTEEATSKRALCLVIGHSISSGVQAEELFQKGQAAIALVRALRLLGYELEIWSEQSVRGRTSEKLYSVLTCLHKAGEIMDESAVEFAVGNPAWLRRLLFGFEEGETPAIRKRYGFQASGGYGGPAGICHQELLDGFDQSPVVLAHGPHDFDDLLLEGLSRDLQVVGRVGDLVLRTGRRLRPQDAGLLASIGVRAPECVRRPRVQLVITGDELLPAGSRPEVLRQPGRKRFPVTRRRRRRRRLLAVRAEQSP